MAGLYYTFPHTHKHTHISRSALVATLIYWLSFLLFDHLFGSLSNEKTHTLAHTSHTLAGIENLIEFVRYIFRFFFSLSHFHILRFYSLRCDSHICTLGHDRCSFLAFVGFIAVRCKMWMCSSVYFGFDSPFKLMSFEWDTHMRQAKKQQTNNNNIK